MLWKKGMKILIVGGDSMIGNALGTKLKSLGIPYYYSTRKMIPLEVNNAVRIDLTDAIDCWNVPNMNWDWIVYCAGITSIAACEKDPSATRNINVTKIISLAKKLSTSDTKHLYLSTSLVFSGNDVPPSPDTLPSPQTEYGKQKLEVEQLFLTTFPKQTIILRLTKVLYPNFPLFVKWTNDLRANKRILPYNDLYIAPVLIPNLLELLIHLMNNPCFGVLHFSGKTLISYAHLAQMIALSLNLEANLITPTGRDKELSGLNFCAILENSPSCMPFVFEYSDKNIFFNSIDENIFK